MDPGDVVRMAKVIGVDLIALTDHHSSKNCLTAQLAAKECGIGFIPGAEIMTSEEVHCICLFPSVESALAFNEFLSPLRPRIKNRLNIFGGQTIVHPDGTTEEEPYLLFHATNISIMDLPDVVEAHGGLFWPAHVDRGANSLLTVLGAWPKGLRADAVEVTYSGSGGIPAALKRISVSDAHRFRAMRDEGFPLPLESADFEGLFAYLKE